MKKMYGLLFLIGLTAFGALLQIQTPCVGITTGTFTTQYDSCNRYFGIKVNIDQTYDQDITVSGSVYTEGRSYVNRFNVTVPAGQRTAQTFKNYAVPLDTSVFMEIFSITPSTVTKGGVPYSTQELAGGYSARGVSVNRDYLKFITIVWYELYRSVLTDLATDRADVTPDRTSKFVR